MEIIETEATPPADQPRKRGPRRPLEDRRNPRVRITVKSAELLRSMRKGDATEAEIIESALAACYVAGTFSMATPQTLPGVLEGLRLAHRAEAMMQVECLKQARLMTLFAQDLVITAVLREPILEEREHRKAVMDQPAGARPIRFGGGAPRSATPPPAPAAGDTSQGKYIPEATTAKLEAELGGLAPVVAAKLRVMAAAFGIPVDELRLLLLHVATEEFMRLDLPPERIKNAEGFYALWRKKNKREAEILEEAEQAVANSARVCGLTETRLQELTRSGRALAARIDALEGNP